MAAKKAKRKPKARPKPQIVEIKFPDLLEGIDLTGLAPNEIMFIRCYFQANGFGADAMELMGHKGNRMACKGMASYYRRKPRIAAVIDKILEGYAMSAAEISAELSHIAKLDCDADPQQGKNKVASLQILAKMKGLLIDKQEQIGALKVVIEHVESKPPENE